MTIKSMFNIVKYHVKLSNNPGFMMEGLQVPRMVKRWHPKHDKSLILAQEHQPGNVTLCLFISSFLLTEFPRITSNIGSQKQQINDY